MNISSYRGGILRDTRARLSEINAKILLAVNLAALQGISNRVAKCHHLWGKIKDVWLLNIPLKIYPSIQKIRQWPAILSGTLSLRVHVTNLKTIQNPSAIPASLNSQWSQRENLNWNYLGKSWVDLIPLLVCYDSIKFTRVTPRCMRNCLHLKPAWRFDQKEM